MSFFVMKPNVVADIGNTRSKWGYCSDDRIQKIASLPPDDETSWKEQAQAWSLPSRCSWVLAGVQPQRQLRLAEWVLARGDTLRVLGSFQDLPLKVGLPQPERVGLDRLLNAVAAKDRVKRPLSILIVDAGSAVTVDWVDEGGFFRGGVIFPGFRLMAKSLNDYTAHLPVVEMDWTNPPLPGNSTRGAIKAGIFWAIAGGIKAVLRQLAARARWAEGPHLMQCKATDPVVFLTGGDAELLEPVMDSWVILWPEMTLEGVRIAAERLE
jgi:type III pantothenate kinase